MITSAFIILTVIFYKERGILWNRKRNTTTSSGIFAFTVFLCSEGIQRLLLRITCFFTVLRIKVPIRIYPCHIIHGRCNRCFYSCIECSCVKSHPTPATDSNDSYSILIYLFPNRKEINSSHEIFCINIRRSHVSWIASTFSRKRRIKCNSKVSFFSHLLRIQSGTLFFDCTKRSTYSNRWIFPKCIFRLIQICSKCDSITIYKCHFLMIYFFTFWKSFIPFRY